MVDNGQVVFDKIGDKIKEAGYKLTPQRQATIETMIKNKSELLTAEEIFMAVNNMNPAIGLATVYRTLDILDKLEIVKKVQFLDGLTRYDLILTKHQAQPYYLICLECKKVKEVKEEILLETQQLIEANFEFKVHTREVKFHGVCKLCQKKESV